MSVEKKKIPGKRSSISLEEKIKILDRIKDGERISSIAKSKNMNEATIRTIRKNEEKIRKYASVGTAGAKRSLCSTDVDIIKTEEELALWIEECTNKKIPLDGNIIRQKALEIYHNLKQNHPSTTKVNQTSKFSASKGWMEKFKQRFYLRRIKIVDENTSKSSKATNKLTKKLNDYIEQDVCNPAQVFYINNSSLFSKKPPTHTIYRNSNLKMPNKNIGKNIKNQSNKNISINDIENGLNLAKNLKNYFIKNDTCKLRKMKFSKDLDTCMKPYKELLEQLQNHKCETFSIEKEPDKEEISIKNDADDDITSNIESIIMKEEKL